MRIFLESGHGLFFMALVFLAGAVMKGAVSFRYKRMIKGAGNLADCKQKQLRQLKTRFENTYRCGKEVPYLEAFVESVLYEVRALGVRTARLSGLGGQALLVSVLLGAFLAAASQYYGIAQSWVLRYSLAAGALALAGGLYVQFLQLGEKRAHLRAVLTDQLGNVWKAKLLEAEALKGKKEERRGQEIAYLKQSLDRIAASQEREAEKKGEEPGFSDSEKEAFEEILKEYFS